MKTQAGQWEAAASVFAQMQPHACTPDSAMYTLLIAALERGGQWQAAAATFDLMRAQV